MRKIIVKTTGTGSVKVEAEGFVGQSCERTLKGFLQRMGGEQSDPELLPEYYQPETDQNFEQEMN